MPAEGDNGIYQDDPQDTLNLPLITIRNFSSPASEFACFASATWDLEARWLATTADKHLVAVPAIINPLDLGFERCIVDTGCGRNLVSASLVKERGYEPDVMPSDELITLDTAGGPSKCKGILNVAAPALSEGRIDALVMANTPTVLSVGERCREYGYGFHWPRGQRPYLETPAGRRIQLEVIGNAPYLDLTRHAEELPRWYPGCAGPQQAQSTSTSDYALTWWEHIVKSPLIS